MPLFFGISVQQNPGPELAITCPKCKQVDVLADSYDHIETVKLLWAIPIAKHRNTVILCSACNSKLYSKLSIDQLHQSTPEQIDRSLYPEGGMLVVTLFLIALMLLLCPIINLIPAVFIPIANRYASKTNRIAGYIPLFLALVYNTWFFLAFFNNPTSNSP